MSERPDTARMDSREKTLLTAVLMSLPGPLITAFSAIASGSATQLADFIRRTAELAATISSWWFYRHIRRTENPDAAWQARLQRRAGLIVAVAMLASAVAMFVVGVARLFTPQQQGGAIPGLVIAALGLVANSIFWRRYTRMTRERYDPLIDAQRRLYRAKTAVDLCVTAVLGIITVAPGHPAAQYIDAVGTIAVAGYLLYSGVDALRRYAREG